MRDVTAGRHGPWRYFGSILGQRASCPLRSKRRRSSRKALTPGMIDATTRAGKVQAPPTGHSGGQGLSTYQPACLLCLMLMLPWEIHSGPPFEGARNCETLDTLYSASMDL